VRDPHDLTQGELRELHLEVSAQILAGYGLSEGVGDGIGMVRAAASATNAAAALISLHVGFAIPRVTLTEAFRLNGRAENGAERG
jgi:hypothetical protein